MLTVISLPLAGPPGWCNYQCGTVRGSALTNDFYLHDGVRDILRELENPSVATVTALTSNSFNTSVPVAFLDTRSSFPWNATDTLDEYELKHV